MSRPYRCAIVGYGYMGEIRKRMIEENPRLELVAICDSSRDRLRDFKDIPTFDSFDEFLKEDFEIIFVGVPNKFAPEFCIRSMRKGAHVFCEKPPGRTLEDIRQIRRAEEETGVKLMFGFNHRFHPSVIQAKSIAESGRLGRIIGLRGLYGKSGGRNFKQSWRNIKELSGGGILLDQGIHMLDLFCYFCGDFEQVKCFLNNSYWQMEVEDNAYVILKNQKGQNGFFHSSATLWRHQFRLDITLEDGYLVLEGLLSKTGSYGREMLTIGKRQFEDEAHAVGNPVEEIIRFDRDLSWELEVQEFVRCIEQNIPVSLSSSGDAERVMEIIEKAYLDADNSGRE